MIPEIGHFALMLALCLTLVQGTLPIIGAQRNIPNWIALAKPVAQGQFVFIGLAFFSLMYAFVAHDYSVLYVAEHSNSDLPLPYRMAAVWGGHEGSLLLWAFILSIWMLAVTLFSRRLPADMVARVLGVMGLVSMGFLLFMLTTSDPFERLIPAAVDGQDLNPLLQDPGLTMHPPMLYMGYVGFSVAFSFAIAALLSGKLDAAWARWSRPWTTVAWMFLTVGIAAGSWWSYYELGWGGWWFWDPVENASFMPWLMGTALLHSLAVTEKRGSFKSWTVLLAIFAFSLSLLGTFLVRSGVLTSVHAFATDPRRGLFILAFLVVVVGGSLILYAIRAPKVGLGGRFQLVSKETLLLCNNVLFVVAAGSVLLGTLYPLVLDAMGLGKLSVGPPYFDFVFAILMAPMVFLMGLGPIARWKKASLPDLAVRLRWAFVISVVTALVVPFIMGRWSPLTSLGLLLAFWLITTIFYNLWSKIKRNPDAPWRELARLPRSYYAMQVAHLGVAVFVIGVTMVKSYEVEEDRSMAVGDTAVVKGYTFRFDGVVDRKGPNYTAREGFIHVSDKNGDEVTILHPEKRIYEEQANPTTEASIYPGLFRDIYASLGEPLDNGGWSVRIYYKPFVRWIWFGCFIMAFGGLLALTDRRYRFAIRQQPAMGEAADGSRDAPKGAPSLAMESKH